MIRKHSLHLLAAALLIGGMALGVRGGDDAPPKPPVRELPLDKDTELQKKYPFESVADRLAYEKKKAGTTDKSTLSDATRRRLEVFERTSQLRYIGNQRNYSLNTLHRSEVENFINREGFGHLRMARPSRRYLELPAVASIAFAPAPEKEPNIGPEVALPGTAPTASTEKTPGLPSKDGLERFHVEGVFNFVNFRRLGLVKDNQKVAGFNAHQFEAMPVVDLRRPGESEQPKEKWQVRRLELMSLLKHEKPVVYLSGNLPRMEELKSANTRVLTQFEEEALKSLRSGEDFVIDAHVNQIRMVGSVRAGKTCLKCHDVDRGELLGAFSYLLQRDPAVTVEK